MAPYRTLQSTMLLNEVLAPARGLSSLLNAAKRALDLQGAESLQVDVPGVQSLVQHLDTISASKTLSEGGVAAAAALAKVIYDANLRSAELALQQVLLQSGYGELLCAFIPATTAALAGGRLPNAGSWDDLHTLTKALGDLAGLAYKQPPGRDGKAVRVRGSDALGPCAVPVLLQLLFLHSGPPHTAAGLTVKKAAAMALQDFVGRRPANCALVASSALLTGGGGKAYADLVASCGDFGLQVDLLEVLYHCAKCDPACLPPSSPLTAPVRAAAAHPAADVLAQLRSVLVAYNRRLGTTATVHSLQARRVSISGNTSLAGPDLWVDFGSASLCLTVLLPEALPAVVPDSEVSDGVGGLSALEPELVEITYDSLAGSMVSVQGGVASLAITLHSLPDALSDAARQGGEAQQEAAPEPMLRLEFNASDLSRLSVEAPRVGDALCAAGVQLPVPQCDASQPERARKVSIAVTYGGLKLQKSPYTGAAGTLSASAKAAQQAAAGGATASASVHQARLPPDPAAAAAAVNRACKGAKSADKTAAGKAAALVDSPASSKPIAGAKAAGTASKNVGPPALTKQDGTDDQPQPMTDKRTRAGKAAAKPAKKPPALGKKAPVGRKATGQRKQPAGKSKAAAAAVAHEADPIDEGSAPEAVEGAAGNGWRNAKEESMPLWMNAVAAKQQAAAQSPVARSPFYAGTSSDEEHDPAKEFPTVLTQPFPTASPSPSPSPSPPPAITFAAKHAVPAGQPAAPTLDKAAAGMEERDPFGFAALSGPQRSQHVSKTPAAKQAAAKKAVKGKKAAAKAAPEAATAGVQKALPQRKGKGKAAAIEEDPSLPHACGAAELQGGEAAAAGGKKRSQEERRQGASADAFTVDDELPLNQLGAFPPPSAVYPLTQTHPSSGAGTDAAGVAALKAALAAKPKRWSSSDSEGDEEAKRASPAAAQLPAAAHAGGRTTPPSAVKLRKGRLLNMHTGSGGKGAAAVKLALGNDTSPPLHPTAAAGVPGSGGEKSTAPPGVMQLQAPAALAGSGGKAGMQTRTPGVTAGGKRAATSVPAKQLEVGGRGGGRRAAATAAAAKLHLGLNSDSDEGADGDAPQQKAPAPRSQQQRGASAILPDSQPEKEELLTGNSHRAGPSTRPVHKPKGAAKVAGAGPGGKGKAAKARGAVAFNLHGAEDGDSDFEIDLDCHVDEDDDGAAGGSGGGGGAALAALLQQIQAVGQSQSVRTEDRFSEDEEEEEEEDPGLRQLQAALMQAVAAKQRRSERQKQAQLAALRRDVAGLLNAARAEADAAREAALAAADQRVGEVQAALEAAAAQIVAAHAAYQDQVQQLWGCFLEVQAGVEPAAQEAAAAAREAQRGVKRKLGEVAQAVKAKVADTQRRMSRAAKRANRLPEIANILMPFLSG